jgi:hypothetical protein
MEVRTASIIALKRRSTSTRLHGAISQKAVIFKEKCRAVNYVFRRHAYTLN